MVDRFENFEKLLLDFGSELRAFGRALGLEDDVLSDMTDEEWMNAPAGKYPDE